MAKSKYNNVVLAPYYEDDAAEQFCEELSKALGPDDYLVIVDDGSFEKPFNQSLLKANKIHGCVVHLSRNVGHQIAINVGLDYILKNCEFESLVIMDSDGEDAPCDINTLVEELKQGDLDVVVAQRKSRVESFRFKLFYLIYQSIFYLLVGKSIKFGNFMALSARAAQQLSLIPETQLHLPSSVMASKLSIGQVLLHRGKRYQGKSKMNIVSLTLHGLKSIMVHSERVLVRITLFSVLFAAIVITAMLAMTWMKISGTAIPGWYSTGGGILILMLFQSAFLALMTLLISGKLNSGSFQRADWGELVSEVVRVSR